MGLSIQDLYKVKGHLLLLGETGCGKTHLAKSIHSQHPSFQHHPFITVNLAAVVEGLLESELFGHAKGAFTGAYQHRRGAAELTGAGTLFLDEVAELSLEGQKKLLRLVEDRTFSAVGEHRVRQFQGRVIAATHRNLEELVAQGKFRQDLYYRLRVFTYQLPPLRDNLPLLEELIPFFIKEFREELILPYQGHPQFDQECTALLKAYPWPGNIRELKHTLEYILSLSSTPLLCKKLLPDWLCPPVECPSRSPHQLFPEWPESQLKGEKLENFYTYTEALHHFESAFLSAMLRKFNGRINLTAEKIKLSKSTLIAKIKKYGINTVALRANNSTPRLSILRHKH